MKSRVCFLIFCSFWISDIRAGTVRETFDESINRAPPYQIFQYDDVFKKKFGANGSSICWPSALAHRMIYFKNAQDPAFSKLKLSNSMSDNVEKFIRVCRTSLTGGTSQKRKVPCILRAFKEAGYKGFATHIGKDAVTKANRRAVNVQDLKEALRKDYGVILHVGWMKFDPKKNAWIEKGSHSVNAYGFDFNHSWGDEKVLLKVADPGMDYSKRSSGEMFDTVEVSKITREPGVKYPESTEYLIRGPGFDSKERLAVLQNVFVFSPEQR